MALRGPSSANKHMQRVYLFPISNEGWLQRKLKHSYIGEKYYLVVQDCRLYVS